ncbi:hypothetical protein I4U23_010378 [Adineta vaga]|nr:hypothetical protein I4U23_010378 [Adineta vaga]
MIGIRLRPFLERYKFEGYNTTVLAYEMTASGSSDVYKRQRLLIIVFLEIYKEKVTNQPSSSFSQNARSHILNKFLFNATRILDIREHSILAPYVPDLKYIQVKTKEDFQNILNLGNQRCSAKVFFIFALRLILYHLLYKHK